MSKRPTIGENPLDSLMQHVEKTSESATSITEQEPFQKKTRSSPKQRITVQISEDVIERVKNAVYWTPGLTLASLAENAFLEAVNALEEEKGSSFAKRKEELKTGRPIN